MRLAGEEFIVNETESLQNEGFLKKFNGGAYRGLNLESILDNFSPGADSNTLKALDKSYNVIVNSKSGISRQEFDAGIGRLETKLTKLYSKNQAISMDGKILIVDPDNIKKGKGVIIGSREVI